MPIEYRFLDPWEFPLIDHFFDREGVPRLDPQFAKVAAAFDGDKIAGILVFQLIPHVEPLIIEPEYQGSRVWMRLAEMVDDFCRASGVMGVFAQPSSEVAEKINTHMGMERTGKELWVKTYYNMDQLTSDWAEDLIYKISKEMEGDLKFTGP
ncbi:MAG: hypothetical protein L0Y56_02735 [Nitrospira sp.]|nr:hypothetical protein [Nitrospira sp.]